MSRTARGSLVAAVVLLVGLGLLREGRDAARLETGTHGTMPWGHRALHDLLAELGYPVARVSLAHLPAHGTIWWLSGRRWPEDRDGELQTWVGEGGTLVLFLRGGRPGERPLSLFGHTLPVPAGDGGVEVQGLASTPRRLARAPAAFDGAADWIVRADAGEAPFVIERAVGGGRLVVVADGRFLGNESLANADAAPLAIDLVGAYGVPGFPEAGGAAVVRHPVAYLARSPALALFIGLALTGILLAWHGSQMPAHTHVGEAAGGPTLDAFVDSLAVLYAGTRDHPRVLERYRALTAARLRRHFGLPPETPLARLVERLRRDRRLAPAALALLLDGAPVASEAALRSAVDTLDALVHEAAV